jgi:hypothetical protein
MQESMRPLLLWERRCSAPAAPPDSLWVRGETQISEVGVSPLIRRRFASIPSPTRGEGEIVFPVSEPQRNKRLEGLKRSLVRSV